MRLIIRDYYESDDLNDYVISLDAFRDKAYHPFIAVHKWDLIIIQVCDKTPRGIIKQLLPLGHISVFIENWKTLSIHQIQVLCEIFPDYAGKIKIAYARDKNGVKPLIEEINRQV